MRTQQFFFAPPHRETDRHRIPPHVEVHGPKKRNTEIEGGDVRHQKNPNAVEWTQEELNRFWENTSG